MTDKCQWVNSQLEEYLSETSSETSPETHSEAMSPTQRAGVNAHLAECETCRREVDGYLAVDKLVAAHFKGLVARAESPVRATIQPLRLAGATATIALAVVAVWVGVQTIGLSPEMTIESGPQIAAETRDPGSTLDVEKAEDTPDAERAKPEPQPEATADAPLDRAPAMAGPATLESRFYVQDAAGYFHTLEDFSGSVLVLGVLDADPVRTSTFADAYESYRSESNLRFVGVVADRGNLDGAGFPTMVNRDSALLETRAGEFAIVGPDGALVARGELEAEELSEKIAASLIEIAPR